MFSVLEFALFLVMCSLRCGIRWSIAVLTLWWWKRSRGLNRLHSFYKCAQAKSLTEAWICMMHVTLFGLNSHCGLRQHIHGIKLEVKLSLMVRRASQRIFIWKSFFSMIEHSGFNDVSCGFEYFVKIHFYSTLATLLFLKKRAYSSHEPLNPVTYDVRHEPARDWLSAVTLALGTCVPTNGNFTICSMWEPCEQHIEGSSSCLWKW